MFRRGARVRPVRTAGVSAALTLALSDPLHNTLAGARLREVGHAGNAAQEFLLAGDEHRPEGLLWNGVNVSPLSATAQALDDFGRYLAPRTRRASSVVGDRGAVEALWQHLAMRWGAEVREYRWSQPLLLADGAGTALPPAGLRAARPGEEDAVFPAAVAMFREEVGVDPLAGDAGRSYRRRVTELIRAGRTYIVTRERQVVFKADVGALFGGAAQIHGVWVDPARRGAGLGRAAMAELIGHVRHDHAEQVCLYVNDFNEPARRAYAAAGFRQVGELSTILF
ncbi:MAG TPA: GNAT family N-acetyltransferase [Candidatus Brachybacterium merdavium]|uniref:GNAT family N-acetyltransferase n=1 Tax=Candidatus Brachybacterium merdavium TaxID=2838513 RepID=A0A9D2LCU2_9MICO|nr:GNAT family N-acetyltransferase [Candidatus Brachybacterium merdavium]